MKRIFIFLISSIATLNISAQTKTTQSLNLDLLGLQYNYEKPLSKSFTINYHGGLTGSLGYSSTTINWDEDGKYSTDDWIYSVRGVVGTDFRYYYNLASREAKGKNTRKNSANFLALDVQYITPAIISHRENKEYMTLLTPYWGLKRVFKNNILLELNLGYNVGVQGGAWGGSPKIDLKVGYTF